MNAGDRAETQCTHWTTSGVREERLRVVSGHFEASVTLSKRKHWRESVVHFFESSQAAGAAEKLELAKAGEVFKVKMVPVWLLASQEMS